MADRQNVTADSYSRTAVVQIYMSSSGLAVSEKEVRVNAGGQVTFQIGQSEPGKRQLTSFAILMKKDSPFTNHKTWVVSEGGQAKTVPVRLDANDPGGNTGNPTDEISYPYAILASDGQEPYYMDPDIVVGPETAI